MKINREARTAAKRLFLLCRKDGKLDEAIVRTVVTSIAAKKPRNYMAILARLQRLVEIDLNERSVVVETAVPLANDGKELLTALNAEFSNLSGSEVKVKPELLGGLRVRVGSRVWDSSVSGKLAELAKQF